MLIDVNGMYTDENIHPRIELSNFTCFGESHLFQLWRVNWSCGMSKDGYFCKFMDISSTLSKQDLQKTCILRKVYTVTALFQGTLTDFSTILNTLGKEFLLTVA